MSLTHTPSPVKTSLLREQDLDAANRVFRLAFGTFLGLPDPAKFAGDTDYVRTRFRADPSAAFGAYIDDELAGSNFAGNWGSVGFFGPLTIRPDVWDKGIAKQLMPPVLECFERWHTTLAGLFTFPSSQKHVGLYQRFGFWPRFLTAVMSKAAARSPAASEWTRLSDLDDAGREQRIADCAAMTDAVYAGLDVSVDIRSVARQRLGDTLLLYRGSRLFAMAVCHLGPGTEAGSGACYVKFGAVRPGPTAAADFELLLAACEQFAAERGAARLSAGVNTARHDAYVKMLQRGFRRDMQGLAMQRPNEAGYNQPGTYLLDDWR